MTRASDNAPRLAKCARVPCKTCPYRRDVPSGIWHRKEYDKLPDYDGDIPEQLVNGGAALFHCHRAPEKLCAGWVGHRSEPHELLAIRLNHRKVHPSVWTYKSPVPLFASGAEAAEHGKRELKKPSARAKRAIIRLLGALPHG